MLLKKKRVLSGILSLMLLVMAGGQMVSAADNEIQPRGPIAYCRKCGTTTNHVNLGEDRTFTHYSYVDPCAHGKAGMRDKYAVYWVNTVYRCTMCGTNQTINEHEERVFVGCVKK